MPNYTYNIFYIYCIYNIAFFENADKYEVWQKLVDERQEWEGGNNCICWAEMDILLKTLLSQILRRN